LSRPETLSVLHHRRNTNLTKSRLDDFETSLINSELIIAELKTAELESCEFPITNMRYSSLTPYRSFVSGLSSSNSATLASIYKGTDLAWENALSEVLAVLKIQYRGDGSVASFLANEENIRQLKYSHVARMEYNRRCIHEDVTASGLHSAPRARRIAKEVAIDYIRKYLDGDYERYEVVRKMSTIANERDAAIEHSVTVEMMNSHLRQEKDALLMENADVEDAKKTIESNLGATKESLEMTEKMLQSKEHEKKSLELVHGNTKSELDTIKSENGLLRDDLQLLRLDVRSAREDNSKLRAEVKCAMEESSERRDEISMLKTALEKQRIAAVTAQCSADSLKIQNATLSNENHQYKEANLNWRDENNVMRAREDEMRGLVSMQLTLLTPKVDNGEACTTTSCVSGTVVDEVEAVEVEEEGDEEEADMVYDLGEMSYVKKTKEAEC